MFSDISSIIAVQSGLGRGLREFPDVVAIIHEIPRMTIAPVESYLSLRLMDMLGAIALSASSVLSVMSATVVLAGICVFGHFFTFRYGFDFLFFTLVDILQIGQ